MIKKITLILIAIISLSLGYSQSLEGTWKISPQAGALIVGDGQGNSNWWSNSLADVTTRACLFDDEYIFNGDGTFNNVLGSDTWLETWQGVSSDGCGAPVAPHNGSNAATWSYDSGAGTLTLTGVGAYMGLAKVFNGGELSNPGSAPSSITYLVTTIDENTMTLDIAVVAPGWWRFIMRKQGATPSCDDGIQNGDETGVDCGGSCPNTCPTLGNLPIDFESNTTWVDFDGGVVTTETNPFNNADNNSTNVGKMVKNAGQVWAGSSLVLNSAIDFDNNDTFTMKVYSVKANTKVLLKVENSDNPGIFFEKEVTMTMTDVWETLTFDYSSIPSNVYDKLVIIFDNGTMGDGSQNFTFYFDDIELSNNGGGLTQIDFPVDFEGSSTDYSVTDFGGNASSLVADPENGNNMVIQSIKTSSAQTWAGTTIGTASGFATNLPFSNSDTKMNVRIWSPDAGIPIRLKAEDAADNTHTVETETLTTVAGGWEVLEFDFANQAPGTESLSVGLSMGWIYNKVSIFFNFGTDGATAGEKTYYFDDVKFGGVSTASLEDLERFNFLIYPNPTADYILLKSISNIDSIEIFDLSGRTLVTSKPNKTEKNIDISSFTNGVYIVRVAIDGAIGTTKIIKN